VFKRTRNLLTFANVCSFLALAVAISTGGAYAANTVFSTDIVDGEVKTPDLAAGAVTSPKILDGAVKVVDLNDGAVTSDKLSDGGVQTADLADGGVTGPKIADSAVDGSKVADNSLGAADLGPSSVGTSEIATDGVGATEVQDNSIDGGEIVDNSLGQDDLAPSSVGTSEVASESLTGADVANGGLTMADLSGAKVSGSISFAAGAVANGRCRDFSATTTGSQVGDAVLMSLRGAVADGIVLSGVRVAVNDQTIIKMCNLTGAASPAITNLPVRLFTFR
jgi:hypothetical protein